MTTDASFFGVLCPASSFEYNDLVLRRLRVERQSTFEVVGPDVTVDDFNLLLCVCVSGHTASPQYGSNRKGPRLMWQHSPPRYRNAFCGASAVRPSPFGRPAHVCSESEIFDVEGFRLEPGLHATGFTVPSSAALALVCSPAGQQQSQTTPEPASVSNSRPPGKLRLGQLEQRQWRQMIVAHARLSAMLEIVW